MFYIFVPFPLASMRLFRWIKFIILTVNYTFCEWERAILCVCKSGQAVEWARIVALSFRFKIECALIKGFAAMCNEIYIYKKRGKKNKNKNRMVDVKIAAVEPPTHKSLDVLMRYKSKRMWREKKDTSNPSKRMKKQKCRRTSVAITWHTESIHKWQNCISHSFSYINYL